jgi:NAD+ synthase (glutamine-hydrolysing)
MKIALAQINTTIGDFAGNTAKLLNAYRDAVSLGADIVVAPELATCGYPPRDLLSKGHFLDANLRALEELTAATGETALVVGYVDRSEVPAGRPLTNSVALLQNGRVVAKRDKSLLPSYDVFDEDRYFEAATVNRPVEFGSQTLGLTVCEDLWNDGDYWRDQRRYSDDPAASLFSAGVDIILNSSASPWHVGKDRLRTEMLANLARKAGKPLVYCNLVGANDELVFDGGSLVFNEAGELLAQGKSFAEDLVIVDLETAGAVAPRTICDEENVFNALVLGVRDYLGKCGFQQTVLGLSGGIDSALTAVIAVEALGKANVRGVAMPSQYSSEGSRTDARVLAANLGIRFDEIPIEEQFNAVKHRLADVFEGRAEDVTEENIQARIRGVTLMAMSNKFGSLLLTTGNKSELAVGYCTLYGDMCGGLAVISDVPKTLVYRVSEWVNRNKEIIPEATITKPPSAELRPDQKDQDSLPDYDVLDAILDQYVVECRSVAEIVADGFDEKVVRKVVRLIEINEYKRRQAAPGLKVTSKAFGVGRRMPVARKWTEPSP